MANKIANYLNINRDFYITSSVNGQIVTLDSEGKRIAMMQAMNKVAYQDTTNRPFAAECSASTRKALFALIDRKAQILHGPTGWHTAG